MKVLLDEDLPHALRHHLPGHEVVTVRYAGWHGLRNGRLLAAAEDDGIEVLVTGDKNLPNQQNLRDRAIAVVVLSSQDWPILQHHLQIIVAAVDAAQPGRCQIVECGQFHR